MRVHGQAFQIFRYGLKVSYFPQHGDFFFLKDSNAQCVSIRGDSLHRPGPAVSSRVAV